MHQIKTILLYSHKEEPVTRCLHAFGKEKLHLIPVSIEELLSHGHIFDELSVEGVRLSWNFPGKFSIENSDDTYLINRLLGVPTSLFHEFIEEDRFYAQNEYLAYLSFAITAFPHRSSPYGDGALGVFGNRFSLPHQWERVRNLVSNCLVPEYYLGAQKYCHLKNRIVYTDPFNLYYWKPEPSTINEDKTKTHSMCFEKPLGKPVIISIIGKHAIAFSPFSDDEDIIEKKELLDLGRKITENFECEISEILFFIDTHSITFGMISAIPYASCRKIWFTEYVLEHYENIQKKLINSLSTVF